MRRLALVFAILIALSPAAGGAQNQRPVFRGAIDLVRVDVIVTDEEGRFADDLQARDFRIFEDGREQEIVDMQLVDLRRGVVRRADDEVSEAVAEDFMHFDESAAHDASEFGAIIFLVDGTTIDTANKARFVSAWRDVIDNTESLRVPRAAYVIDSDRRIRQVVPFTTDTAQLREAADVLDEAPAFGNSIARRLAEVARHVAEFADEPGVGMEVDAFENEEAQRSYESLQHLTQFSRALSSRPGRKALVWVSAGVKITQGGPYTAVLMEAVDRGMIDDPFAPSSASAVGGDNPMKEWIGKEFDDYLLEPMLVEAQEELHEAANTANVSIYSVDPTSRNELRTAGQMAQGRSPLMVNLMGSGRVQSSLDGMRDVLREASAQTGGRSFIHWSELPGALTEIEDDTSRFYLLAYAPPTPEDGEYHEIAVEVARPGLQVRQRRGYLALAETERSNQAVAAALQLPGATHGLDVSASAFRKWNTVGEALLQFAVSVDGATPVIPDPGGTDAAPLRVTYVALDDQQRTVWRSDQEVLRRVEEIAYGEEPDPFVFFDRRWRSLDPGRYDFRVAVLDPASGHIGATQLAVEVPRPTVGWRTSDLMLGLVDEAGATRPLVHGRAGLGSTLLAFAEVYGGASPVATVRVLRPDDSGEPAGEPWAEIDAEALPRYVDNVHRAAISLPAFLAPGSYVIELVILDFTTRNETTLRAPLEIY
jgi:VWFA-related protein